MKLILPFAAIVGVVISVLGSARLLKVKRVSVASKRLPKKLDGLTILQISDLHANSSQKMNLDIWKTVRKLDYDMVMFTGDIINHRTCQLYPHLPHIKRLDKPIYYCIGNHDLYDAPKLIETLKSLSINVLNNKTCFYERDGEKIEITGIFDVDSEEQLRKLAARNENFKIVISHFPDDFCLVKNYQPDLMVSGHVHGGQLRLPFVPTIFSPCAGFFPKYGYGIHRFLNSVLFISKGIGHTFFPIRLWNRPEIVLIELKCR